MAKTTLIRISYEAKEILDNEFEKDYRRYHPEFDGIHLTYDKKIKDLWKFWSKH